MFVTIKILRCLNNGSVCSLYRLHFTTLITLFFSFKNLVEPTRKQTVINMREHTLDISLLRYATVEIV